VVECRLDMLLCWKIEETVNWTLDGFAKLLDIDTDTLVAFIQEDWPSVGEQRCEADRAHRDNGLRPKPSSPFRHHSRR
jgi:hypothetical protein